jgi:hypothetical protein
MTCPHSACIASFHTFGMESGKFSNVAGPRKALSDQLEASNLHGARGPRPPPHLHYRWDRHPLDFANLSAHSPQTAEAVGPQQAVHD